MSSVCPSVCLSLCPSVTLVDCDHIGWNSSKIISPLVSLGCSLFATTTWRICSKGNTPKFGPKVTHPLLIWASETFDRKLRPNCVTAQIAQRSQWGAYRKLPSLFLMVPSLTPYDLPFSQNRGSICSQHTRMAISPQPVVLSTSCLVIGWAFRGRRISNGAIFDNKLKMAAAAILDNFEWPYLRNGSRSTYIASIARSSLR